MDDRSLFTMLSMVKGIGSWSVHMFVIFSLHRPDVLPVSDLGVRKGVQLLYSLEDLPRPSQTEQLFSIQEWDDKEEGKEVTQQWEDDWDDDDVNDDFSLQLRRELESSTEKNEAKST
ncbi:unnamed protein product [Fraxinus pennsylvanica]|uniref:26S proteasome complex subunit SEM1 n=1 Tax=Fraxinus pennsylvanica TaxID=56036 RepID=A0AAD2AKC0_9LAMI|nr:unnamed protein product [Fraxinus pennsylvanica]